MEEFQSWLPGTPGSVLSEGKYGPWLLGLKEPTALDAHLVTFVARMRDVGRNDIIPEELGKYVDVAMEGDEWNGVMQGRKTMVPK